MAKFEYNKVSKDDMIVKYKSRLDEEKKSINEKTTQDEIKIDDKINSLDEKDIDTQTEFIYDDLVSVSTINSLNFMNKEINATTP